MQIGAVLQLLPDRDALTFRAVHGTSGVPGKRAIPADPSTQAGFTLQQAALVVVEDWQLERRLPAPRCSPITARAAA